MPRLAVAERREALIEAALRVTEREGLAGGTTRAIVAEAGMSLASFHYAFSSREELPACLGFFRLVHDARRRGRALPGTPTAGLVAETDARHPETR